MFLTIRFSPKCSHSGNQVILLGCCREQWCGCWAYSSLHLLEVTIWKISFFFKKYLFIYLWLCWVFVSVRGLSLVAASGGHSSSRCASLSLSRPLLLRSTDSRCAGSVVVAHGPSCSAACGIFPDQGSNPCPLHWQAYSQPLRHQGSPERFLEADRRENSSALLPASYLFRLGVWFAPKSLPCICVCGMSRKQSSWVWD